MAVTLSQRAEDVGRQSSNAVGLDPITIMTVITTVLPAMISLFQSCKKTSEPADEQAWLKSKYNERRGEFAAPVLRNASRAVRDDYEEKTGERLTTKQSREIAHRMMYEGMAAKKSEYAAWKSAAG